MIGQAERLIELKKLEKTGNLSPGSKVIAFSSGKGGTGKTFLSLNTAFALSKNNYKILFADLDLNFANSNILLNIIPKHTINSFFQGNKLLPEVINEFNDNLHFIFGESGKLDEIELNDNLVLRFFNQLNKIKDNYDFIIIDSASGGQRAQINLLALSDINVIVASPEPTAVMDAYVMVKLLCREKYNGKKLIAVNKARDEEEGQTAFNNIKAAVNHFLNEDVEYIGYIKFDETVIRSISSQEILILKETQNKVISQINKIASRLSDILHMANIQQSTVSRF